MLWFYRASPITHSRASNQQPDSSLSSSFGLTIRSYGRTDTDGGTDWQANGSADTHTLTNITITQCQLIEHNEFSQDFEDSSKTPVYREYFFKWSFQTFSFLENIHQTGAKRKLSWEKIPAIFHTSFYSSFIPLHQSSFWSQEKYCHHLVQQRGFSIEVRREGRGSGR